MRPLNVLVGLATVGLAVFVAVENAPRRTTIYTFPDGGLVPDGGLAAAVNGDSNAMVDAGSTLGTAGGDADAPLMMSDLPMPSDALGDGGPLGSLTGAPRAIRFGVVMVTYVGVETMPNQPPPKRTKADAKALADRLAEDAKTDFHGAVQRGDSGSMDDAGRINNGDLEGPANFALFSLPVGGVTGVIDTPRGFWIAKRVE